MDDCSTMDDSVDSNCDMIQDERDLAVCNDAVNAISNSCKRLVRCGDGSLLPLNQEGGVTREDINNDALDCMRYFDQQTENPDLPWVFGEKFRKDIMDKVYRECIPALKGSAHPDDALVSFCRSLLPGLKTLRRTLRQKLAETNNDSLTVETFNAFFDFQCTNVMCAAKAFVSNDEDVENFPPPNVAHPWWVYNPDAPGYLRNIVVYIRSFVKNPLSKRCTACNLYFRLTEGDEPVDLFGLPEQFIVNDSICSLYGMYKIGVESDYFYDLQIARVPSEDNKEDYVVYQGDRTFY